MAKDKTRQTGEVVSKANLEAWETWIVTVTGATGQPATFTARCCLVGKECTVHWRMSVVTANANTFTMNLLYAAANTAIQTSLNVVISEAGVTATVVGRVDTRVNSNIVDIYKTAALGVWSATANRVANFSMTYEIA